MVALLLALPVYATPQSPDEAQSISWGRFGRMTIYRPARAPTAVVLFVSGDGGWHLGVVGMARALRDQGALVIGIDIRTYLANFSKSTARCESLAVDFENLSHRLQKELKLPEYIKPMLYGYSSGATLVYAAIAQAPTGTFAGAVSLGFCADQDFRHVALCPGAGLHYEANHRGDWVLQPSTRLRDPWVALQGQQDAVCNPAAVDEFAGKTGDAARVVRLDRVGHGFGVEKNWRPQFLRTFAGLEDTDHNKPLEVSALSGLPLTVVSAPAQSATASAGKAGFALLLSGDGGWAGLDREVAQQLADGGLPVVGLDSLRYFWKARKPEEVAADVSRILRHYANDWRREQINLIGYSFGADVLPAIVNLLPQDLREHLHSLTLIAPSASASYEVHVLDWLPGSTSGGDPVLPQLRRLGDLPLLCMQGHGESEGLCPHINHAGASVVEVGTGHHLGGDYASIATHIQRFIAQAR